MSTQQINARSQAAQGVLSITRPQAGDQFVYEATEGLRIALDFPVDAATLSQDGNNLVFAFPDGGQVVLTDFFAQYGSAGAPSFVVEGQELPGEAFLTAFNADLLPAAGPGAGGTAGGGVGDYQSDPGDLINTVDRLGLLDPSPFPDPLQPTVLTDTGILDEADNGVTLTGLTPSVPGVASGEGAVPESALAQGSAPSRASTPQRALSPTPTRSMITPATLVATSLPSNLSPSPQPIRTATRARATWPSRLPTIYPPSA